MTWKDIFKRYYDRGYFTAEDVALGVVTNKITEEEFKEITGKDYDDYRNLTK